MKCLILLLALISVCLSARAQDTAPSQTNDQPTLPQAGPKNAEPSPSPVVAASDKDKLSAIPDKKISAEVVPDPPVADRKSTAVNNSTRPSDIDDASVPELDNRFNWKPALIQSGIFMAIQHSFRMSQPKTTRELGGKFFADWRDSLKNLKGWRDGNKWFTNYIAHPMQGSMTGRIFINNSGRARRQEFGGSKEYWMSRLKAAVWTAVWSTQFEIGPISEASIGNVGLRLNSDGSSKLSYVDLVITPTLGTGFAIAEDAVDKYILKNWIERKTTSGLTIKFYRSILTPVMSFANILRGKAPWYREYRRN
ncbi:MAG: hypothetical protein KA447_14785 [Pyrinomonadaceae bacterium]|nr:hypothetical protein [Pyrinomonadaceae bacterium]